MSEYSIKQKMIQRRQETMIETDDLGLEEARLRIEIRSSSFDIWEPEDDVKYGMIMMSVAFLQWIPILRMRIHLRLTLQARDNIGKPILQGVERSDDV